MGMRGISCAAGDCRGQRCRDQKRAEQKSVSGSYWKASWFWASLGNLVLDRKKLYTRGEGCRCHRSARTGILDGWIAVEVGAASQAADGAARCHLPHGTVQTPVFMPVGTAATVKAVPQETLERIGANGAALR